jgi:AcrR family transcriptional regulator
MRHRMLAIRSRMINLTVAAATRTKPKARLRREDWVRAALDAMAERGLAGVAVEPLARRLGVTKGSFYSHFSSRDELIEAALESWEQSHAEEQIEQLRAIGDPAERLAAVLRMAAEFSQSGAPSVHARLMGELDDPRVRAAVARVNGARVDRLGETYRELGLPERTARHRARIAYAAYVGLLQMSREAPRSRLKDRELEQFLAELRRVLIEPR